MPAKAWEDVFISLDFMRKATMSKANLCDSDRPQQTPLQLHAHSLEGERLPIPLVDNGDSWSFSLGHLAQPITDLVLEDDSGQEVLIMDELMPRTDQEYEHGFRSISRRSLDPYLNFFIARQMALHFPGTVSYRISATVVALYKAIEIQDPNYLDWAETLLRLAEDLIPLAPVARSPRRNREHLQASLWCAEWHVRLVRDDFDGFLESLEKVRNYMEKEKLASYFNVAYPANTTLSMLCLYHSATGKQSEARLVMRLMFSLFQRSVRDADTTSAHFRELAKIHEATYECLLMVKRTKPISEKQAKTALRRAVRINPSKHDQSFLSMWNTLKQGLRL